MRWLELPELVSELVDVSTQDVRRVQFDSSSGSRSTPCEESLRLLSKAVNEHMIITRYFSDANKVERHIVFSENCAF